jgi:hypothetical protein
MNRKQLTLLIVLGVVLGGLGWLAYQKNAQPYKDSTAKMGDKVLPGFQPNDVEQVIVSQAKSSLTVAKQNDNWVVKNRGDYPANFDNVREFLIKFADLKIAKPVSVGPSRLPVLELVAPDKGNGTLVDFRDKSGKSIKTVLLGAKSMKESSGDSPFGGGGAFANGRYVMVGSDIATVALVTEPFNNAEPKPEDWLNKEWFKAEHHKTISIVTTNATNNWKLSRESETNEWKLADAKAGEELDRNKSGALNGSFNYPQFNDVATNGAPSGLDKPAFTATIETFEGFTYTAKVGNKVGEDAYYFQIAVAGNFPKDRTLGKDEKPEDKTRLDKEFADALKKKEDKLKAEQAYGKWTYVVSKWTVDPLMKERKDLIAEKKEEPKPEVAPAATPPPALPGPLTPPPVEKK